MKKMDLKKTISIVLVVLFVFSGFTVSINSEQESFHSDGDTLYVGGSGSGNYSTIQSAIENASDGDSVFVYAGNYTLSENITISKSIHLTGESRHLTIVGTLDVKRQLNINVDNVKISHLSFKNICFDVRTNNVFINNNNFVITIFDNYGLNAVILTGSVSSGGSGIEIKNNSITLENRPEELFKPYWGILVQGSYHTIIVNNTISGAFDGLKLSVITYDNTLGDHYISKNTFTQNENGLSLWYTFSASDTCVNQIIENNFINNDNHAVFHYVTSDVSAGVFFLSVLTNNVPSQYWNGNYWDDHQSTTPRTIHGVYHIDPLKMIGINTPLSLDITMNKKEIDQHPSSVPL